MKVFVEGIYIPNTNEWWIDETWTVEKLKLDVLKIATEKKGNPDHYNVLLNNEIIDEQILVCDLIEEGESLTIKQI